MHANILSITILVCVVVAARWTKADQFPYVKWTNDEQISDLLANRTNLIIIDTRNANEFNGWSLKSPNDQYAGLGHLNGSFNFDVDWLDMFQADLIDRYLLEFLNLTSKTRLKTILDVHDHVPMLASRLLLYDTSVKRLERLRDYLSNNYVTSAIYLYQVRYVGMAANVRHQFHVEPNHELIVSPEYIYDLLYNSSNTQRFRIFDVSDGDANGYYTRGHIPKSVHLDTNEFEEPPFWSRKNRVELSRLLLSIGIRQNNSDVIVLYGHPDLVAAYRVAVIMKWMGVHNVRILNGGYKSWLRKNFPVERLINKRVPDKSIWLNDDIFLRPNYIVDIDFVLDFVRNYELFKDHYSLVDLRSFNEYVGNTNDSIRGRIPHAIWGKSMDFTSDESTKLYNYRNPDSTMRSMDHIRKMWSDLGIDYANKHLVFYCSGGWRASEVLYYAELMGLKRISMYDGGWIEWSKNGKNLLETGVPKTLSSYISVGTRKFQEPKNSASCVKRTSVATFAWFEFSVFAIFKLSFQNF